MNELLSWALDLVQSVDPALRTALAAIAMLLETSVLVGLFVPGDTVVIVTATAVSSFTEGFWLALAIVVGSLAGESIGFWLGRTVGPRIRHSRLGARLGEHNWSRAERYLASRGGPAVFISRFLPVLHSLVPLTVGMSGVFTYRRFLAWSAPACALWATAYVAVGSLAAGTYRDLSDELHYAGYLFVGAMFVLVGALYAVKKIVARRERRHYDADALEGVED